MRNALPKNNVSPQTTTPVGKTHSEKLADQINVSESHKNNFQYTEARAQPCMSILWPISDAVLRCKEPVPAQIQSVKIHKLSDEDREFFMSGLKQIREDTKKMLGFLLKFDDGISVEDTHTLANAINAINRAVIVA